MNLISANLEAFCIMARTRTPDGQSGWHTVWSEGTGFDGCIVYAQTARANVSNHAAETAQMPDPKPPYVLYTSRAVNLPFHCIIKRASDGQQFRILSDSDDMKVPKGGRMDLRLYSAEKWREPHDQS